MENRRTTCQWQMRWRCSGSYLSVPYGISGIQTAGEGKIQMQIKGREREREREMEDQWVTSQHAGLQEQGVCSGCPTSILSSQVSPTPPPPSMHLRESKPMGLVSQLVSHREGSRVGSPESSGQLVLACQRTGDSPITLSPLLILITPLRPLLSNKTLIQVLRGTGSLLLVMGREEKTYSESSAMSPCEHPLHLYRHSPWDRPQSQPTGVTAASMAPPLHPSWGWSSSQLEQWKQPPSL